MLPTAQQLDELVRRIIQSVHPLRIILFGSAARGEMGPNSDVDVLVVMPEGTHRRHTMEELHGAFAGLPFPVDALVATPSDLETYRHTPGMIYRTVLAEGMELYAA
jgi:predicted nucleotidyltransferase